MTDKLHTSHIIMAIAAMFFVFSSLPAQAHTDAEPEHVPDDTVQVLGERLWLAQDRLRTLQRAFSGKDMFDRDLERGMRGGDVKTLQYFLREVPGIYPEGIVSGYFGLLTEAAVARWQVRQKIVMSGSPETTGFGRVGPQTRKRLNQLFGAGGFLQYEKNLYRDPIPLVEPSVVSFPSAETVFSAFECREQPSIAQLVWREAEGVVVENDMIQPDGRTFVNIVDCKKGQETAWVPFVHYPGGGMPVKPDTEYIYQIFYLDLSTAVDRYLYDPRLRSSRTDIEKVTTKHYSDDAVSGIKISSVETTTIVRIVWTSNHLLHNYTFVTASTDPQADLSCWFLQCESNVRVVHAETPSGGRTFQEGKYTYFIDVDNLESDTAYYYRVHGGADFSPTGAMEAYRNYHIQTETRTFRAP